MPDPEELARQEIDALLGPCGWTVQDKRSVNLSAARGVAVREAALAQFAEIATDLGSEAGQVEK
jgi:hypothetical protein